MLIPGCNCARCLQGYPHRDPYETPAPIVDEAAFSAAMDRVDAFQRAQASLAEGTKHDGDKIRTDLYPVASFLGTCRVLTHGAKKYAARNWEKGIMFGRVYGALLRHLFAWWGGEDVDPESGEHHLDHAGCCVAFLQHYAKNPGSYATFDDRPKQAVPVA